MVYSKKKTTEVNKDTSNPMTLHSAISISKIINCINNYIILNLKHAACIESDKHFRDKRTDVTFEWPPKELIQACRQSGCNLKAVGFLPPIKGMNCSNSVVVK